MQILAFFVWISRIRGQAYPDGCSTVCRVAAGRSPLPVPVRDAKHAPLSNDGRQWSDHSGSRMRHLKWEESYADEVKNTVKYNINSTVLLFLVLPAVAAAGGAGLAVAFTWRGAVAAGVVTGRRDAGVVGSTGTLVSATRRVQGNCNQLQYGKARY